MGNDYFQKIGISFILFTFLTLPFMISAQVGIGTTDPDSNALLELDATDTPGGLLMPRVALTATNNPSPLSGTVVPGMTVYNTASAGSGANSVAPGFYYHDGTDWVRIATDNDAKNNWNLTGNSDTDPTVNFLGTKDAQPLLIKTNGNERMRVLENGQIAVNSNLPFAGVVLNSFAGGDNDAIAGAAENGTAIHAQTTGNGDAIVGISVGTGDGVVGLSQNVDGVVGQTSGTGVASGVFGLADNQTFGGWFSTATPGGTPGSGTGLIGIMGLSAITILNGSGVTANGVKTGLYATASASGTGTTNNGNAAGEFDLGTNPTGGVNTIRARAKIAGYHRGSIDTLGGSNPNNYYGGYFSGGDASSFGNPSYTYVGIKYNANNNARNGTNYKIIGNGTVSTLVDDSEGNKRILFSPEAPEILFEDYGVGQLKNGSVYIQIDQLFSKSIHVSEKHPLKVFIQLEGECNGVYVTDKTANGFLVKELHGGTSNTPFSYHLVANRADDIAKDGSIASKHVGLRFPYGPKPVEMAEMKVVEMKKAKSKKTVRKEVQNSDFNSASNIQTRNQNSYSESQSSQH